MHIGRLRGREGVIGRGKIRHGLPQLDDILVVGLDVIGILVALVGHVGQDCDEHRAFLCGEGKVCAFIYE